MSALARYFNQQGKKISGYDLTPTPLTDQLIEEGMKIQFNEDFQSLSADIDMVIYTPAIPKQNKLYQHLSTLDVPFLKRSQVLGLLSENMFTIAIAGTHGKTSISAITAHLLKSNGIPVTALIGGICKNYNSNAILSQNTQFMLVEADEFDKSFLTIKPDIALISSMDSDHLDVYNDRKNLVESFKEFSQLIKTGGTLFYHYKLKGEFIINGQSITYGMNSDADIRAENIRVDGHSFVFDFVTDNIYIQDVHVTVPGKHYIENATAAMGIGLHLGLKAIQLKRGIESFTGVERRFEIKCLKNPVYIDDYAHHPEEIRVTIEAIRMLFPGKKITGIFQPHLYSRTRDFAIEFAKELSKLDEIILLEIYPAREKPIKGVSSEIILEHITNPNKRILAKKELLEYVKIFKNEILLTIGAGDIGILANKIENLLKS